MKQSQTCMVMGNAITSTLYNKFLFYTVQWWCTFTMNQEIITNLDHTVIQRRVITAKNISNQIKFQDDENEVKYSVHV